MTIFLYQETIMGSSLHNRIYLGRRAPRLHDNGVTALAVLGTLASAGLVWLLVRALK
jgi:hypothetical protein